VRRFRPHRPPVFNIRNLRLATNLTDLFGAGTPEWQTVQEYTQRFGYGNQLFVIVEAGQDSEESAERWRLRGISWSPK